MKKQLLILLLVVLIGFIGIAMPYPIFAPLFLHPDHGSIVPFAWGMSMRSIMLGITLAVYPFGQFFGAPILGRLSDIYGRKPVLIISLIGATIGYLITAVAVTERYLILLIAARLITGFLEGNITIARAIAADLPDVDKYKSFGLIGAAATSGYIFGPILGGLLADNTIVAWFDFSLPFIFAAAITSIATMITYCFLMETRHRDNEINISIWQEINIFKRIKTICQDDRIKTLLVVAFLLHLSIDTYYEFFPMFLVTKWHFTSASIALCTVLLAISIAFGDGWLVAKVGKRYSVLKIVSSSLILFSMTLVWMLFVTHISYLYIAILTLGIYVALATTTISVSVSDAADESIQGEINGILWGTRMLGDSLICIAGSFLLAMSYYLPLLSAVMIAFVPIAILYTKRNNVLVRQ